MVWAMLPGVAQQGKKAASGQPPAQTLPPSTQDAKNNPRLPESRPLNSGSFPASVDSVTGVVHSQKLASGVPLGGIGTGTFQMLTDGTVGQAAIADNAFRPQPDAPGCFAALWTRTGTRTTAHVLALANAYHLPVVTGLDFDGLFPQANLAYPDKTLPVQVSLLMFSPLVPFDLKNSSFPAVACVLTLKNPTTAPIEVSATLSWESLLSGSSFVDRGGKAAIIPSGSGFFGARFIGKGKSDAEGGEMALLAYPQRGQAVVTTGLWDASETQPKWWDLFARTGDISEEKSAQGGVPEGQGVRPAAVVAVRLTLKPGESVELPFAVSWYLRSQRTPTGEEVGHYYEVAFASAEEAGHQLLEDWRSLYGLTEEWQKRLMFSNMPRWMARRLINSAAPLSVNTIHTRDGRFAFLGTVGSADSAAMGSAGEVANSDHTGAALTGEQDETRAHQAAEALLLALYPQLAAQELIQAAAIQNENGSLGAPASADWSARLGPERPGRKPLIPMKILMAPQADKGEKREQAGSRPQKGTSVRSTSKTPAPLVGKPSPSHLSPSHPSPALAPLDATADYVFAVTRFALWTGDQDFLKRYLPNFQKALRYLLALPQTEPDLLLSPASATEWLAALQAGQKTATLAGDSVLAQNCGEAVRTGTSRMEARFWNGQFYATSQLSQENRESSPKVLPNAVPAPEAICASDQLWGQWLAYQLDLGPLLPPEHLMRAAQSLLQYNDRITAPGSASSLPAWQVRADGKPLADPAASDCLLPASLLADAMLNIWQERPEIGVALLARLEDARNNGLRSPWQYGSRVAAPVQKRSIPNRSGKDSGIDGKGVAGKTGKSALTPDIPSLPAASLSSSLAVASDWNILSALEGFALDMNSHTMALAPNIPGTWRTSRTPIFAPTFWGRLEYRPTVHGGVTTFRLDRLIGFIVTPGNAVLKNRAELTLARLRVLGPPRRQNDTRPLGIAAHVSQGQKSIGCHAELDTKGFVLLSFDSPLTLTAGDRLEVEITEAGH